MGMSAAVLLIAALRRVAAAVPQHPPGPLSFNDKDPDSGEIGGHIEFPRAVDETDITRYVVYFGSSTTARLLTLVELPQTGIDPDYDIPMNTGVPSIGGVMATHFLAFSANDDGEDVTGVNLQIHDVAKPRLGPSFVEFDDEDYEHGTIAGRVTISRASNESDVTDYALYYGTGAGASSLTAFVFSAAKSVDPLVHHFPNGTVIPLGATHLLGYTANADGLTIHPFAITLVDRALPADAATSLEFLDTDMWLGEVSGTLTIGRAADEALITHYAIYFAGSAAGSPRGAFVGLAPATGAAAVRHFVLADTLLPPGVSHLLVVARNSDGEMATGITLALVDRSVPANPAVGVAFHDVDIDAGELGGTITVLRAADESDVDFYAVFFADWALSPLGAAVAEIPKGPDELNYTLALGTVTPVGAAYLLVLTGRTDGLMATGVSASLWDRAIPLHSPTSAEFIDEDVTPGLIGGRVTVQRAGDESDVSYYVVYYDTGPSMASGLSQLGSIAVSGLGGSANAVLVVPWGMPLVPPPAYFFAVSGNLIGEMRPGSEVGVAIVDRTGDFPQVTVVSLAFLDQDLSLGEISGVMTWTEPAANAGLLYYRAYIAADDTGTNRQQIGNDVPTSQSIRTITFHTALGASTHLIVYAYNSFGEGPGAALAIVDQALPLALISDLAFADMDKDVDRVGGQVIWQAAPNSEDAAKFSGYVVYFASSATGAAPRVEMGEVAAGTNSLSIPWGINIASGTLSHVVVYTKNSNGEARSGVAIDLVDIFLPTVVVEVLQFFDQDLGVGELGGTVAWQEPANTSFVDQYRTYLVDHDGGTRLRLGDVSVGSSAIPMPFNTPMGNFTTVFVVAANSVGEALDGTSVPIVDHTAESCPTEFGHGFKSSQWRVVAGPATSTWRLKSIRFYEDPFCTRQLPGIPAGWPRRPRQLQGAPFANPPAPNNLHELFRDVNGGGSVWENATKLGADPNAGPWWSTGMPCVVGSNASAFPDREFPVGSSHCYVGFSWESESFIVAGRVHGSGSTVQASPKSVHCAEVEQAWENGHFATALAVQYYDTPRAQYRTLMERSGVAGGMTQLSYQRVVAAECAARGR